MATNCEILWDKEEGILIASLRGRIDTKNADEIQQEMDPEIASEAGPLVIDFQGVTFLSSAGLRVVLRIAKSMNKQAREFAMASLNQSVHDVVEVSGLDQLITIYDSRSAAISDMRSSRTGEE